MIDIVLPNLRFNLMLIISCKSITERDMFHRLLTQPTQGKEVIRFQHWTLSLQLQQCKTVEADFLMIVFRKIQADIVHCQIFRANLHCFRPFVQICFNRQKETWLSVTLENQIIKPEGIEMGSAAPITRQELS